MRRRGRLGLLAAVAAAASVALILAQAGLFEPGLIGRGLRNAGVFLAELWPPVRDPELLRTLLESIGETLRMAWAGTLLGAALALPLAVLAAAPLSRPAVARPVRALLAAIRTIPSILWAILFVVIVGLGSLAGILALAAYTCGYLGKLLYETLEGVDRELLDAARATGASPLQVTRHAVLPEMGNALLSQGLFALEYNVRASSILGLVGAGGIGFYLMRFVERFEYAKLATALVLLFLVVVAVDGASRVIRRRFLATPA